MSLFGVTEFDLKRRSLFKKFPCERPLHRPFESARESRRSRQTKKSQLLLNSSRPGVCLLIWGNAMATNMAKDLARATATFSLLTFS